MMKKMNKKGFLESTLGKVVFGAIVIVIFLIILFAFKGKGDGLIGKMADVLRFGG